MRCSILSESFQSQKWTHLSEVSHVLAHGRKEANMCFYFAKPTVVNPVKDVVRYECMDWCSFLEAITMIVR